MNKCAFPDEEFDKADHIGEIRKRPTLEGVQWTPAEQAQIKAGPMKIYWPCIIRTATVTHEQLVKLAEPRHEFCQHEWARLCPEMDDTCTKCGMSFTKYFFTECP